MSNLSEQVALAQVQERLATKYADVPVDQVSSVVLRAREYFEASPIRDFVPLLVERRASNELLTRSASASA